MRRAAPKNEQLEKMKYISLAMVVDKAFVSNQIIYKQDYRKASNHEADTNVEILVFFGEKN